MIQLLVMGLTNKIIVLLLVKCDLIEIVFHTKIYFSAIL